MKAYHRGYESFSPDPGKKDEMFCRVCGTKCDVERNRFGARSRGEAMSKKGSNYDHFFCPRIGEEWHDYVIKLMHEHEGMVSTTLRSSIRQDAEDVLESNGISHCPLDDYDG